MNLFSCGSCIESAVIQSISVKEKLKHSSNVLIRDLAIIEGRSEGASLTERVLGASGTADFSRLQRFKLRYTTFIFVFYACEVRERDWCQRSARNWF